MADQSETNKNILIVDDELGLREGCRRALGRYGYKVDVAATGQEALSKVLATDFGVAFLDVIMPDISGIELLQHIHTHAPNTVCIVMTAYATVELAVQAMKRGAYDFIEKPFSDDTLLEAVERGLDKGRLLRESVPAVPAREMVQPLGPDEVAMQAFQEAMSASMRKVAHELRAPIAAIRSFLTLILQGYTTPEKTREWQQRAAERADDLLRLVDDLLNLARLRDPKVESTPEIVSVEAVLKEVLGLHVPETEAKGIWLRVETRPCGSLVADPAHIKQLWTNLISNAIKYTPRGGQVSVRLYPELETIVGVVQDTGIGISRDDLPHLFDEFFRTEQAKAFSQHGTGLGLPIVRQILRDYGGEIAVASELGRGSTFTFRLPLKRSL
jgi:signal transduction histidine kinase